VMNEVAMIDVGMRKRTILVGIVYYRAGTVAMAWRRRNQEYFLCGDGQAQARLCENNFFQRDVGIDTIFPAILYVLLVQ
jgi:hypothetical protein